MSRSIEVDSRKTKQGAISAAERLSARAFAGQVYTTERVHANRYAIVLTDNGAMPDELETITRRGHLEVDDQLFRQLAGQRSYRKQRGLYRTFA